MKVQQLSMLFCLTASALASVTRPENALHYEPERDHKHHIQRALIGECTLCPTTTVELQPVYYSEQFPSNAVIYPFRDGKPFTVTGAPTVVTIQSTLTRTFGPRDCPASSSTFSVILGTPGQSSTPGAKPSVAQSLATTVSSTSATGTSTPIFRAPLFFGQGLPNGTFTDLGNTFVILAFSYSAQPASKARRDTVDRRQQKDASSPVVAVNLDAARGLPGGVSQDDCDSATPLFLQSGKLVNFERSVGKTLGTTSTELRLVIPGNAIVTRSFSITNGMLQWNATDLGPASFFDCGGLLVAGFALPPSTATSCVSIQVGVIAGSACRDVVSQTRSVNSAFIGPVNTGSTAGTAFSGVPTISASTYTTSATVKNSLAASSGPGSAGTLASSSYTSTVVQTIATSSTMTPTSISPTSPSQSSVAITSSYTTTMTTVVTSSSTSGAASSITSLTTGCPASSTSSCSPASSSAAVLPPPQNCNNRGVQYAIYGHSFANTDPPAYSNADPAYFRNRSPLSQGVFQPIGFSCPDNSFFCGGTLPTTRVAVNQRSYLYVPVTGIYSFTLVRGNEISFLWLGTAAYSGYNRGNAAIVQGGGICSSAPVYVPLVAGQYFAIRVMTINDQAPRASNLRIVRPDCQVLLDYDSVPTSDYLVQFSCTGVSGPPFPAFGNE